MSHACWRKKHSRQAEQGVVLQKRRTIRHGEKLGYIVGAMLVASFSPVPLLL